MASARSYSVGSVEPSPAPPGVLRLYSMRFCPYASRIRIILGAKHIPHDIVNIDLRNKPQWFLAKAPDGKVPALEIGTEVVLHGSLTIADYLDSVYPEPRLWPSDPLQVAKGKMIIDNLSKLETLCANSYSGRESLDWEKVIQELQFYENVLDGVKTTFFSGDRPSMVDYFLWPVLELLEILWEIDCVDDESEEKPSFSKSLASRLARWRHNLEKDSVIKKTSVDMETGVQFYRTFKTGHPQFDLGLI